MVIGEATVPALSTCSVAPLATLMLLGASVPGVPWPREPAPVAATVPSLMFKLPSKLFDVLLRFVVPSLNLLMLPPSVTCPVMLSVPLPSMRRFQFRSTVLLRVKSPPVT